MKIVYCHYKINKNYTQNISLNSLYNRYICLVEPFEYFYRKTLFDCCYLSLFSNQGNNNLLKVTLSPASAGRTKTRIVRKQIKRHGRIRLNP